MDIQNELILSYYKELSPLSKEKNVYLVQHVETNSLYVRKIIDVYNSNIYHQLKSLNIPGIPQIYECIEDDNKLYVIEEYIHGRTLEDIYNKEGLFKDDVVTDLTVQLCAILNSLHSCNPPIIHRDIKPSNLILTSESTLKLIDFNAAKNYIDGSSKDTTLLGTQNFAAPEQYGFSQSDIRTDIYGLGVTMNFLLTGKYPNEKITDGKLNTILSKCLKLSPDERYIDCNALLADLNKKKLGIMDKIVPLNTVLLIITLILLALFGFLLFNHRAADSAKSTDSVSIPENAQDYYDNSSDTDNSESDAANNTSDDASESTDTTDPGKEDQASDIISSDEANDNIKPVEDSDINDKETDAEEVHSDTVPSSASSSSSKDSAGSNNSSSKSNTDKESSSAATVSPVPTVTPTPEPVVTATPSQAVSGDNTYTPDSSSEEAGSENDLLIPEVNTDDLHSPVDYYIDGDYIVYTVPDFVNY